jgi:hypothetical protein
MPKSITNRKNIFHKKKSHFVYENLSNTIVSKGDMIGSKFLRKLVKREFVT